MKRRFEQYICRYREAPSDGSLIKADGEHGSYGLAVLCLYFTVL